MPKPIFVTGATGSIGGELVRRLSAKGVPIRVLVRDPKRAQTLQSLPNVELVQGDLGDVNSLVGKLDGCGVVYHCAAKVLGSDKADFLRVNVGGTVALVEEAKRSQIDRFVHVSSVSVYGYPEAQNIAEDTPLLANPATYPTSKQQAEKAVSDAAKASNLPIAIARPGDVVGPGQYAWTIQFAEKTRAGILQPPMRRASGYINPVYIDNLIDALILLGEHPNALGETFNVVDGVPHTFHDYIKMFAQWMHRPAIPAPKWLLLGASSVLMGLAQVRGREATVTPEQTNFLYHHTTFSNAKIRSKLGWSPAVNWAEANRRTHDWLIQQGYIKRP